jgi:hypothetical protein
MKSSPRSGEVAPKAPEGPKDQMKSSPRSGEGPK